MNNKEKNNANYTIVMKKTLELSATIKEALEHIQYKYKEEGILDYGLLEDITNAFYNIEKVMNCFINELPENKIAKYSVRFLENLDFIVKAMELNSVDKNMFKLIKNLLNSYINLNNEIDNILLPLIVI